MTENFEALATALDMTQAQAIKLVENSITASFCDEQRKQAMTQILNSYQ